MQQMKKKKKEVEKSSEEKNVSAHKFEQTNERMKKNNMQSF